MTGAPAVISFTFDDAPRTAATEGARIVESLGAGATFYIATSLCGEISPEYGAMLDHSEIRDLATSGHHIAAHSHSHTHLRRGGEAAFRDDCARNKSILEDLSGGAVDDFAYPFGEYTFAAKAVLADLFTTQRSIDPGVNQGDVDLRLLKSETLEQKHFSLARVEEVVSDCAENGGWLIFFTHDVSDDPTEFGTTPSQLRDVVRVVQSSGVPVADVATARRHLFV